MTPVLLTAEQVAEMLQVSTKWIYQSAKAGDIRCIRQGRLLRFRLEDIHAWLEAHAA